MSTLRYPYRMQLHGASDLDHRCLKTRRSKDGCTFPPNIFTPTPKITPEPHFGEPFNAKPIIQIALRKSHVNGTTKVKLHSYISIGKYLGVVKLFPLGGVRGVPLNVNLAPPIISETTGARKLNSKNTIGCGKVPALGTKIIILCDTT